MTFPYFAVFLEHFLTRLTWPFCISTMLYSISRRLLKYSHVAGIWLLYRKFCLFIIINKLRDLRMVKIISHRSLGQNAIICIIDITFSNCKWFLYLFYYVHGIRMICNNINYSTHCIKFLNRIKVFSYYFQI